MNEPKLQPVPPSQSLDRGTVGQAKTNGTPDGTNRGTVSLKALANKVLSRDKQWDKKQDTGKNVCPTGVFPQEPNGTPQNEIDSQVEFEERAAILEYDAGLTRSAAETLAQRQSTFNKG